MRLLSMVPRVAGGGKFLRICYLAVIFRERGVSLGTHSLPIA
jgi:hypothetical protein